MDLAIRGGEPIRSIEFPRWPSYSENELHEIFLMLKDSSLYRGIGFPKTWYDDNYNGSIVEQFELNFGKTHNCKYCFTTNSGSTALDIAVNSLNLSAGDEVLGTPYTYFASASAIKRNGAKPIFVDINPQTLNMDVTVAEKLINSKTKAMVIVHFGGIPAKMQAFRNLADKYELKIIEDCCHTIYAKYDGQPVGSWGNAGCFSFQSSKLLSSGEGGAVITNDINTAEFMFSLHNGGRRYNNHDNEIFEHLGTNYRLSLANIAFLNVGIQRTIKEHVLRKRNVDYLKSKISNFPGFSIIEPDGNNYERDYYIVALRYNKEYYNGLSLKRFVLVMNSEGIPCTTGYNRPLYENSILLDNESEIEKYRDACPETERCLKEVLWFSHNIFLGTKDDMDDIFNAMIKVKEKVHELVR